MRPFDIKASRFGAWLASAGAIALLLPAAGQLLDTTLADLVDQEVAEQVESGITQQIETSVQSAVEQVIESEVVETLQQQVESGVVSTIAEQLESSVAGEIGEQLLDAVEGEIDNVVEDLDDTVGGVAGGAIELGVPLVAGDSDGTQQPAADRRSERFVADVDAFGRSLERDVWIILVPTEHAERIPTWGFTIRERQDLATLDRVLLRVAAPEDREIAQAALELALDAPGTEVDFNHVYRPGADGEETTAAGMPAVDRNSVPSLPAPALSIGIIDTAIAVDHDALRRADVVQRDFVPFEAERPTAHGTAVASILVGDAAKLHAQLLGARVYAASVFFADEDGNDASTAASLTVAGEWLAAHGVRVINMSLAGPPNRVLEAAIAGLVERGIIVVAAVGNNAPNGARLYPAAYPHVVGVTAIDSAKRIYRYANRGPHVAFAALGVDVRVARSGGGYRELSGTSVAAPHAAAVIVRTLASRGGLSSATVVAELKSSAQDLGAKDFDDTFGFGLIEPLEAPVTASR